MRLAGLQDVQLFGLQRGNGCEQIDEINRGSPASLRMPLDPALSDQEALSELAALIVNMDLIVTVDTSIAHLAGALGKPVWVLLSRLLDWRWMIHGAGTPWYPTMRLFRQKRLDRWEPVFNAVRAEIQRLKQTLGSVATIV